MNQQHKIIREMLRQLPVPEARAILDPNLPPNERDAIFYADVMQENLGFIADKRICCSESSVKQYRKSGYSKLAAIYSKN